jgi:hypothetical protein
VEDERHGFENRIAMERFSTHVLMISNCCTRRLHSCASSTTKMEASITVAQLLSNFVGKLNDHAGLWPGLSLSCKIQVNSGNLRVG